MEENEPRRISTGKPKILPRQTHTQKGEVIRLKI
jgi:hypothetical protein